MSLSVVIWSVIGLGVWSIVVAAVAIAWGKAHPAIQSAIAQDVNKAVDQAKKL